MQSPLMASEHRDEYLAGNALVCSDNLDVLKALPDNSIDLIYLDPPFQSDTHYVAVFGDKGRVDEQLRDIWRWTTETMRTFNRLPHGQLVDTLKGIQLQAGPTSPMSAYCVFMARRLLEMRRVLKTTGSIYLHCNDYANYYLRLIMDAIFGSEQFRNAIVWESTRGRSDGRHWGNVTNSILFYTKSNAYQWANVYKNRILDVEETTGDLTAAEIRNGSSGEEWQGYNPTDYGRHWAVPRNSQFAHWIAENRVPGYLTIEDPHKRLDALDDAGLITWSDNGRPSVIRPSEASPGAKVNNLWYDIPRVSGAERIGYPTQKPLALMERIIEASSPKNGIVMDPFCGCGTAVDAAAKLGRGYLGIDVSAIAVRVMEQRLMSRGNATKPAVYMLEWSDYEWADFERRALMGRDDAEDGVPGWAWAEDKVAGLLNAIPNSKKTGDGGVDARYYGAAKEVIPIQVKMHRKPVGRPDMDKLLGAQTAMNNRGIHAPMSLMVSLYPPPPPQLAELCSRTGPRRPAWRRLPGHAGSQRRGNAYEGRTAQVAAARPSFAGRRNID